MDADRGPVAGDNIPTESGDQSDDSEARSRSHPLRRLIGPEPAAPAAPEAAAESEVPSLASVSIRRGAGSAKNQGRTPAQKPRQAQAPQASAQSAAEAPQPNQVPAQAAPQQPPAETIGNGGAGQVPVRPPAAAAQSTPAARPPQKVSTSATSAANGSGQAPKSAATVSAPDPSGAVPSAPVPSAPVPSAPVPSAPSQATPSQTVTKPASHGQASAAPVGNGVRPTQPAAPEPAAETASVSIRKSTPSIRKPAPSAAAGEAPDPSEDAGPAGPSIRKPASEAAKPESAPSIRKPGPAQPEAPTPVAQRRPADPEPAPALQPAPPIERTPKPVLETSVVDAAESAVDAAEMAPPMASQEMGSPDREPPAAVAPAATTPAKSSRTEPGAAPPRGETPSPPPVQARQPEPPVEPAPPPIPEPVAPLPVVATPPPINEGVFDEDGAMRIGYVISVSGRKVYGVMIPDSDVATEDSMLHLQEVSQIGDLVKMPTSRSVAFGMISSLEIRNPSSSPPAATDQRVLEIDLFGEGVYDDNGDFRFQRGISIYPSLGTEIRETTHLELAQIYAKPSESNVLIGSLYQDSELPAYLLVDDLLGKHFAVLGTTGTGKSCSTTVILRSILDAHPNGHVVLLDPHNEYGQAFDEYAEVVRPDSLNLPFWLLNFEELVEVICTPDQISRKAEVNILKEAVYTAKLQFVGESDDVVSWLTVDTPVPYRLSSLVQQIEDAQGQLERPEDSAPYQRIKTRIQALRSDRRYDFMFAGLAVKDSMAEVLSRLLRIPVEGRPITILQLSGVPSEIVDVVVSLLCRMVFDFAMWSMGQQSVPVLLVCEEAHRYIPQDQSTGFAPTRKAIARIAKEGRKYGVSICLVTQRPSELSETILSQCNTIFTLRMSNERDQVFVRRAMPDSATGMLNALPALRNQEAIVVGEGVTVPMRIRFADLESYQRPQSDTAVFSDAWEYDQDRGDSFLHDVVDRWRRQSF